MREIIKGVRTLGGEKFTTYATSISGCNSIRVEVGTNGLKGGDHGHGSRTYFRIEDEYGTAIYAAPVKAGEETVGFEVRLGGDSELLTVIEALKFIVEALEDGVNGKND